MLSFFGLTSASPAKPAAAQQQPAQKQEQKNTQPAKPNTAQKAKNTQEVKPVTPQQAAKQDQKPAKTQDDKQKQQQQPKQQQQKNATAPAKQSETPKENQTSKAAPVQQPTKMKPMTPAQQLEMQQILNILIDDAGKDWKPRDKTNKQPQQKPAPKQAQKTPKAQAPKPQDAKASKASQKSTKSIAPVQQVQKTAPALTRKVSMSPAQLQEQKEILNILIDEDWTPPAKTAKTQTKQANQKPTTRPGSAKPKQNTPAKTATTQSPSATQKKAQTHSYPKLSLSPAQQLEMQQILNILIDDTGKDWKPRNKTVKPHVFSKRGSQKLKSRPTSATPKQKTPTQKASTQSPPPQTSSASTPRPAPKMTLTPAQQVEMQQILNILIDDAGKDWKPRNKSKSTSTSSGQLILSVGAPKQPLQKTAAKKQGCKPAKSTPAQKPTAQKAATPKAATPNAPAQQTQKAAPTKPAKLSLTPAQQLEMQQILNILIDDAGKDWKPREKKASPQKPSVKVAGKKTVQKSHAKQAPQKKAATQTKPSTPKKSTVTATKPLHRRRSLTDAQKREKRAIMEILLEPYEYVPAPVRPRSSTVQLNAELDHKVGNVVVVSNQPVDASEDLSGFETIKSRRTNFQEKKQFRQEIGDIMSILIDWTEPLPKKQAKQTPKKKTPQKAPTPTKTQTPTKSAAQTPTKPQTPTKAQATKTQTAQQQKAPPASTHIQANKNQRAKLST
ncbi:hypothetical protein AC1031_018061 [Aphanomyces cochlioides]|nr:hypothetical protein AC1031_018061 [Aphanomyces cochlioides]